MNEIDLAQKGKELVSILRRKWWMWIPITLVTTLGALTFALVKQDVWQASQTMVIRDEAAGQLGGQGRFDNMNTMKAAQEMVVEVSRNFNVLETTLREVGPAKTSRRSAKPWPSIGDVEDFRKLVEVAPPNGAEFGTTEVLHLSVDGETPQRAIALTNALAAHLDRALKDLRGRRAAGVIQELTDAARLAQNHLDITTERLEAMEREVGSDLGELRKLSEAGSGDGGLQVGWGQIKQQIRDGQSEIARLEEQLRLLKEARDQPDKIVGMPGQLLETQPALRRLKEGLVDTQLKTAELLGRMSEEHPLVKAALTSEREVQADIRAEIGTAISGIEAELLVQRSRLASVANQEVEVRKRLDGLAGMRARYTNLVAEVVQANQVLQETQHKLGEAKANQQASLASSVITLVDSPTVGEHPLGPGKTMILAAGIFGGLLMGGGLIFLTTPLAQPRFGRRWTDQLWGRRATDDPNQPVPANGHPGQNVPGAIPGGRRASDPVPPQAQSPGGELRDRRSGQDRRAPDRRQADPAPAAPPQYPVGSSK
ncbi:MAG: Wzz/FepE/Etk N-terminal domain-containing protein [Pirellulaceae bacterium]